MAIGRVPELRVESRCWRSQTDLTHWLLPNETFRKRPTGDAALVLEFSEDLPQRTHARAALQDRRVDCSSGCLQRQKSELRRGLGLPLLEPIRIRSRLVEQESRQSRLQPREQPRDRQIAI